VPKVMKSVTFYCSHALTGRPQLKGDARSATALDVAVHTTQPCVQSLKPPSLTVDNDEEHGTRQQAKKILLG